MPTKRPAATPSPAQPREAQFDRSPIFDQSFVTHVVRAPAILAAFETFLATKRQRPPGRLSRGMRDHTLGPPLDGFRECHLAPDACLLYTDKNDRIVLVAVCSHDEIEGKRAKALLKQVGQYRT